MSALRFALFGAGFWAQYQLAAWQEVPEATCVALYNRTRAKAEALAHRFQVPAVYDDPVALLRQERLDFVDIVTDPATHPDFVALAAAHRVAAVCQKPLALSLEAAERMVALCREAGVRLIVHENWRWQRPIREVKRLLASGVIGRPFRASVQYCSSFPVFENQPALKTLPRFILLDMGTHILDVVRFLFGEPERLYCQIQRVHPDILGEDVATVMLQIGDLVCLCSLSYASRLERERFPETFLLIEGEKGSLELGPDYWVRVTTAEGTHARRYPPPRYRWADPDYAVVHASIVPCHAHIVQSLRAGTPAETEAEDNLQTLRLVFAAYDSAARGAAVSLR